MKLNDTVQALRHPVDYLTKGSWFRYCVKQLAKCKHLEKPWEVAEGLVSDNKFLEITFNGEKITLINEHAAVYYIMNSIKTIEKLVSQIELPEKSTVLDIGANAGLFTFYLKKKFPNAKVIAVEPSPKMVEVIKRNLKDFDNVFIEQMAVTKFKGEVPFYINEDSQQTNSTIYSAVSPYGRKNQIKEHLVQACTLKNLMDKHQLNDIDLIKIDIQGGELEVLKSSSKYFPKIKQILTEVSFINNEAIYLNSLLLEHYKKAKVLGEVIMGADILFYN